MLQRWAVQPVARLNHPMNLRKFACHRLAPAIEPAIIDIDYTSAFDIAGEPALVVATLIAIVVAVTSAPTVLDDDIALDAIAITGAINIVDPGHIGTAIAIAPVFNGVDALVHSCTAAAIAVVVAIAITAIITVIIITSVIVTPAIIIARDYRGETIFASLHTGCA